MLNREKDAYGVSYVYLKLVYHHHRDQVSFVLTTLVMCKHKQTLH